MGDHLILQLILITIMVSGWLYITSVLLPISEEGISLWKEKQQVIFFVNSCFCLCVNLKRSHLKKKIMIFFVIIIKYLPQFLKVVYCKKIWMEEVWILTYQAQYFPLNWSNVEIAYKGVSSPLWCMFHHPQSASHTTVAGLYRVLNSKCRAQLKA